MPKKLDRKRDFGEVMGHEGGAAYVQDEVLFDAQGIELVTEAPKAAKPASTSTKKATAAAKAPADPVQDQLAANLQGAEGDPVAE